MSDAPLRARPEDRPLPPSGEKPAVPTAAEPARSPRAEEERGRPSTPDPVATPPAPAARPGPAYTRAIGRRSRPPVDWRRAWWGFLIGLAEIGCAIGVSWALWDMAGPPRIVEAPAERLAPVDLAEIEALLDGLGFPPGKIDGEIDPEAAAAIRDFQATAGLATDGAPSAALLEELRAAHAELFGGQ